MSYLANCSGSCETFKGNTGNVWVIIDQMAYDKTCTSACASMLLMQQNATWTVTVPPRLAPGEYVLRHEILGLQVASQRMGAQFYFHVGCYLYSLELRRGEHKGKIQIESSDGVTGATDLGFSSAD